MTEKQQDKYRRSIVRLVELWQQILPIKDWEIMVEFVRINDMMHEDGHCLGQCRTHPRKKQALVAILDPQDHCLVVDDSQFVDEIDVEKTVVHELLHIVLDKLDVKDDKLLQLEQIVHQLSEVLVGMSRRVK